MFILYVLIGVVIGIFVAAPIGAVNLIVINRSLQHGPLNGFLIGSGAAVGDGLFAVLAAFGFTALSGLFDAQMDPLRLVGGILTLVFAWFVWRAEPKLEPDIQSPEGTWRRFTAVFTLTVTNPATLMGFTAIFAGSGFKQVGTGSPEQVANAAALVIGVTSGSLLWWLAISWMVSHLRERISQRTFTLINHATAVGLALFGVGAIIAGLVD